MKFLVIAAVIVAAAVTIYKFIKGGKAAQIQNLKEWLLYATALAERELGSGTGRLKLRHVYDMFVVKFPWLAMFVSFEKFADWVDDSLDELDDMIATNDKVREYVIGTTKEE